MKAKISFLFASVVLCFGNAIINSAFAQGTDAAFNFDNDEVGKLPADWTPAVSTWIIVADGTNHEASWKK